MSFILARRWSASVEIGSFPQNLWRDEDQEFGLVVDVRGALEEVAEYRDVA
jgi:hypothetical protein